MSHCRLVFLHRGQFRRSGALFLGILILIASAAVYAQDAVRPSLAGQEASDAREEDVSRIPYNLLLGPVRFRVGASVGLEYNDNINYSDDGTAVVPNPFGPPGSFTTIHVSSEEDFIVTPNLTLDAVWPITQLNTLRLDLGIGYSFYLDHNDNNTDYLLVAPKSQLAFDIFVGDFRINIHDKFELQQDPVEEGALSNVVDYGRFENTAGLSVLWDLNKLLFQVGYDHYNFISTTSQFDYLNRNSEIVYGSAVIIINPTISVGPEGNAVFTRYDDNFLNDNEEYSVGGFIEAQITNNLKVRAAGGYQWIDFDNNFVTLPFGPFTVTVPDNKNLRDYYVNGLIGHRINAQLSQTISAGHESQLGVNSNYIKLNYVRHTLTWNLIRNTLLSTEFFYEDAEESGGFAGIFSPVPLGTGEHFHRIGGAITLGYQLTPHITLGVRYQGTSKDSDLTLRDYNQNRVSIDGTYSF
jgi:hypothetical protein